jgi:uncharacterized membrane protein YgaE (UPF0421/DUF939 family)
MSVAEHISILTASAKVQYIAIGIFTIAFGIFYAIAYIDQFKDIRNKIEQWRTSIFGSKKSDLANEPVNKQNNQQNNTIDDEMENETSNLQETLSPF